jgi:hypothetical protein
LAQFYEVFHALRHQSVLAFLTGTDLPSIQQIYAPFLLFIQQLCNTGHKTVSASDGRTQYPLLSKAIQLPFDAKSQKGVPPIRETWGSQDLVSTGGIALKVVGFV